MCANKIDAPVEKWTVSEADISSLAIASAATSANLLLFKTSAKSGKNVISMFRTFTSHLFQDMIKRRALTQTQAASVDTLISVSSSFSLPSSSAPSSSARRRGTEEVSKEYAYSDSRSKDKYYCEDGDQPSCVPLLSSDSISLDALQKLRVDNGSAHNGSVHYGSVRSPSQAFGHVSSSLIRENMQIKEHPPSALSWFMLLLSSLAIVGLYATRGHSSPPSLTILSKKLWPLTGEYDGKLPTALVFNNTESVEDGLGQCMFAASDREDYMNRDDKNTGVCLSGFSPTFVHVPADHGSWPPGTLIYTLPLKLNQIFLIMIPMSLHSLRKGLSWSVMQDAKLLTQMDESTFNAVAVVAHKSVEPCGVLITPLCLQGIYVLYVDSIIDSPLTVNVCGRNVKVGESLQFNVSGHQCMSEYQEIGSILSKYGRTKEFAGSIRGDDESVKCPEGSETDDDGCGSYHKSSEDRKNELMVG